MSMKCEKDRAYDLLTVEYISSAHVHHGSSAHSPVLLHKVESECIKGPSITKVSCSKSNYLNLLG